MPSCDDASAFPVLPCPVLCLCLPVLSNRSCPGFLWIWVVCACKRREREKRGKDRGGASFGIFSRLVSVFASFLYQVPRLLPADTHTDDWSASQPAMIDDRPPRQAKSLVRDGHALDRFRQVCRLSAYYYCVASQPAGQPVDSSRGAVEISQAASLETPTYTHTHTVPEPGASGTQPRQRLSAGTADGRLAEPPRPLAMAGKRVRERARTGENGLWGPTVTSTDCFPTDGRDLGDLDGNVPLYLCAVQCSIDNHPPRF